MFPPPLTCSTSKGELLGDGGSMGDPRMAVIVYSYGVVIVCLHLDEWDLLCVFGDTLIMAERLETA